SELLFGGRHGAPVFRSVWITHVGQVQGLYIVGKLNCHRLSDQRSHVTTGNKVWFVVQIFRHQFIEQLCGYITANSLMSGKTKSRDGWDHHVKRMLAGGKEGEYFYKTIKRVGPSVKEHEWL